MPHTNKSEYEFFLPKSENNGVWSLPYTFLFAIFIFLLFGIAQVVALVVPALNSPEFPDLFNQIKNFDLTAVEPLTRDGERAWPAAIWGGLIGSLLIFIAIRVKNGLNIVDYLNIHKPKVLDIVKWVIGFAVFIALLEFITRNVDAFDSAFMEEIMHSTKSPFVAFFAAGIIVPIFEELFFRGFLFTGIEKSHLGGHAAVWITSVVFALVHLQYSMFELLIAVLPMALIIGYSRLYSGTIIVPIILHMLNNMVATFFALKEIGTI